MKISYSMSVDELAERMGNDVTNAQAAHMRESLAGLGAWDDTKQVPDAEWQRLVAAACAQAAHD